MTTEERISIIKNKAKRDYDEKEKNRIEQIKETDKLMDAIKDMSERINDIITLANACVSSGVKIPRDINGTMRESGSKYGYPHEFIADGIYHHVGLIQTWPENRTGTYEYIGIDNGGACGCYDFWTDGDVSYAVHESHRADKRTPRIEDMKNFLKEFPKFEKGFLNWIDSLA